MVKIIVGVVAAFLVVVIVIAATSSSDSGDNEPAAGDVVTDGTTNYDDELFEEVVGVCVAGVGSDSPDATQSQLRSFCECAWNNAQEDGIPFSVFTGQDSGPAPDAGGSTTAPTAAATPEDVQAVFDSCDDELAEA